MQLTDCKFLIVKFVIRDCRVRFRLCIKKQLHTENINFVFPYDLAKNNFFGCSYIITLIDDAYINEIYKLKWGF